MALIAILTITLLGLFLAGVFQEPYSFQLFLSLLTFEMILFVCATLFIAVS